MRWPLPCRPVSETEAARVESPGDAAKRPIKMLHDRLLVKMPGEPGERTSSGGILIPATAQLSKRLVWGEVVGVGPKRPAATPMTPPGAKGNAYRFIM